MVWKTGEHEVKERHIGPVERREDYKHIKMTWTLAAAIASFFALVGGAVVWLGGEIISPGANVSVLAARIDDIAARQAAVNIEHSKLGRRVDFLVIIKCQEMDAPSKRVLAAAGFSCTEMEREVRSNGHGN